MSDTQVEPKDLKHFKFHIQADIYVDSLSDVSIEDFIKRFTHRLLYRNSPAPAFSGVGKAQIFKKEFKP